MVKQISTKQSFKNNPSFYLKKITIHASATHQSTPTEAPLSVHNLPHPCFGLGGVQQCCLWAMPVGKYSGFAYNGTLTNFTLTGARSNWIAGGPITTGNMCSVALPVELLSFEGKYTEGGNLLIWTTANEVNNKGFDIERLTVNGEW